MGSNGVMLLIIIICVILSGYFSATETAFSAINRVRIRNQAEKGNKRAALVLQLSDNYDSLLSTILIGNNIVNIGCSSLATILFVKLLGEECRKIHQEDIAMCKKISQYGLRSLC